MSQDITTIDYTTPQGAHYKRVITRVVKANETPAAKMQRLMDAAFRKYAQEFPAQALEIVRQEVLDKRVVK